MSKQETRDEIRKKRIDPLVFWPALIIVGGLSIALALYPAGNELVNSLLKWLTFKFDWFFQWATFLALIFLAWLAIGRYSNVKLGGPNDEPEFDRFTWIAMLFCGGIGAALLYWAIAEPVYYMQGPPFQVEALSSQAAEWASLYGMFHWGFSAWAIYCVPAVAIAYSYYVRKQPQLKASVCCRGILGDYIDGILGKVIDVLVVIGLVGGVGTTLGLNVPMISAITSKIFNLPDSFGLKVIIVILWVAIFGLSAYLGLYEGISKLSDINVKLVLTLLAFVLIVGPTTFILSNFTNSVGLLLQKWIRMSLWTDPINEGGFPQNWTVFYWAWWVAYAVFMGLFVARISRGRTIREVIIANCIFGTLGCWVCFGVLGSYAVHLQMHGILDLIKVLQNNTTGQTIATVVETLPFSSIVLPFFGVAALVFQATTLDSAAYTLASITTRKLYGDEQPARWNRLFWAGVLGACSIVLMAIGGLKPVQLSSVFLALPVVIIIILLGISLVKWLNEDFGEECAPPIRTVKYEPDVKEEVAKEIYGQDGEKSIET